jgi:hypothetical protein
VGALELRNVRQSDLASLCYPRPALVIGADNITVRQFRIASPRQDRRFVFLNDVWRRRIALMLIRALDQKPLFFAFCSATIWMGTRRRSGRPF